MMPGPYESEKSMVQMDSWTKEGVPPSFGKELYPGDLERLAPHLEVAMEAFPCFAHAEIQSVVNGPITYTPDILPMVGPTMLPNMWVAVGFGYGKINRSLSYKIFILNLEVLSMVEELGNICLIGSVMVRLHMNC